MKDDEKLLTKVAFHIFNSTVFQKAVMECTVPFDRCVYVELSPKEYRTYKKMSNMNLQAEAREFYQRLKSMIESKNPHKDKKSLVITSLRYLGFEPKLEIGVFIYDTDS